MAEEGSGGIIETIKEKYYNLVAWLEEKGVPYPNVVVPVVIALVLLGIMFFAFPALFNPTYSVQFSV